MSTDSKSVGHGAVPDAHDIRDYKAKAIMAAAMVDWTVPFQLPDPPQNDQNGSESCVAQAWSYYHWQLRTKDYSRRDIYSQIYIPPDGGAQIRDGGLRIINYGQATRDETPDPIPETEMAMRDVTGVTQAAEASDKELNSFLVPYDIDSLASAISQYKGVVFGVTGSNEGWTSLIVRPPLPSESTWGHALYLYGYHLHNGLKCVIARSSWAFTPQHHIQENYFVNSGQFIFNPWTLIPLIQQLMNLAAMQYWLVQDSQGTGAFGLVKNGQVLVATADRLAPLLATYIVLGSKGFHSATATEWANAPKGVF